MAFLMFSKSISTAMNQYCQRLSSMQKGKDFMSLTLGSSPHKTQANNTISKLLMRLFKTFQDSAVCENPGKELFTGHLNADINTLWTPVRKYLYRGEGFRYSLIQVITGLC